MNHLRETLSQYWLTIQGNFFPWLSEDLGPLTEKQQQLITVLELSRPEKYFPSTRIKQKIPSQRATRPQATELTPNAIGLWPTGIF